MIDKAWPSITPFPPTLRWQRSATAWPEKMGQTALVVRELENGKRFLDVADYMGDGDWMRPASDDLFFDVVMWAAVELPK